jgi:hypothetical protein
MLKMQMSRRSSKRGGGEMQCLVSWIDRFMAAKCQEGEEDEIQKPLIIYS